MHPDVKAFDDEWKNGDRQRARRMARAYVIAHRAEMAAALEKRSLQDIVELVTAYRNAGREEDRIVADMWLLAEYEPQRITGKFNLGGLPAGTEA